MQRFLPILVLAFAAQAQPTPKPLHIFDFHNSFWINLHQFLCHQAAAKQPEPVDNPDWQAALAFYHTQIVPQDSLSASMTALNDRLSRAESAARLAADGLDANLAALLQKAAPVYRERWWTEHQKSNAAWIEAVQPLLAKYGDAIKHDVAAAYQTAWPDKPIRTDVSAYAGPYGAYTSAEPSPHITISSTDPGYRGNAALEMLFHESSHTIDEKLRAALQSELKARGRLFRRRGFDHAILFYTAGAITRKYIAGYELYGFAQGIWEKGWPGSLPVLEKDWKPYLDGKASLDEAVKAVVEDYGVEK